MKTQNPQKIDAKTQKHVLKAHSVFMFSHHFCIAYLGCVMMRKLENPKTQFFYSMKMMPKPENTHSV